jgi:hypothetical protein
VTRLVIAIAGAVALAAGSTRATDDKSHSASGASAPKGQTSSSTTASTDAPVSGDVKSTDPVAMVITVVLPSGDEQDLNVGNDAQIQRDGSTASISQVQPGDNVRASFDPKTHKASKVDVKSKGSSHKDSPPSNSNQNK